MRKKLLLVILFAALAVSAFAQNTPGVEITFPPPVYVIGGQAEIVGTANADGQVNYFLEYQPLGEDLQPLPGQESIWFPATLPARATVINDVLGVWDTTDVADGLYALRLHVTTQGGTLLAVVAPLRVDNGAAQPAPPTALDESGDINEALLALTQTAAAFGGGVAATPPPSGDTVTDPIAALTATAAAFSAPVATPVPGNGLAPTPTSFDTGALTAEVLVVANLRSGDSTLYSIQGGLQPGTVLDVLGRSSRGTNWLNVRTPDGEEGWVAPSVVRLSGNILNAPEVNPPPPPVTPTPTPTATPVLPDANVLQVRTDRDIQEDEPFQVIVTIRNDGGQLLPNGQIFCNVEPMNVSVTFTGGGLPPGNQSEFVIPLRIDSGGGQDVTIICAFDPNQFIEEANRANNTNRTTRFLEDDD
jgi:hypothetical protein